MVSEALTTNFGAAWTARFDHAEVNQPPITSALVDRDTVTGNEQLKDPAKNYRVTIKDGKITRRHSLSSPVGHRIARVVLAERKKGAKPVSAGAF